MRGNSDFGVMCPKHNKKEKISVIIKTHSRAFINTMASFMNDKP
jgi:hypothetical protein